MTDLLQRLRERKLVQWMLAYLAAAFALLQGLDIVAQQFGWPDGLRRGITVALAVGFFVALVLAWYHGERGTQRVTGTELLILALLLAIGGGLLWRVAQGTRETAAGAANPPGISTTQSSSSVSPALQAPGPEIRAKSIAVLPFENLSEDKANAYFATGMQDEILTRLAGIGDLKVISRTSTEQYASRPPNLKIVAEQLGVATVLEGSVQKASETVHINVQLIDARTDSHLWAQSYDRDLKDIFGVQRDVAQFVAEALKAQLLPAETARIASAPTQDPQAYDLYLRANAHLNRGYDQVALVPKEIPLAIALYQQALAKDPHFALAAATLGLARLIMYWQGNEKTQALLAAAKEAVDQALTLQPDLGEAHLALGVYWYWGFRDYPQALQQLDIAHRSLPNNANIELYSGAIARRQGRWEDGIAAYQRAIALDPRSSLPIDQLAYAYTCLRRYAEADQTFERAVAVTQDPIDERAPQAISAVLWKGDLAPLRAALGALAPGSDDYAGNASYFFLLGWWSRDYAAAARAAETDTATVWSDNSNVLFPRRLYLAWAYEALGDSARSKLLYTEVRTQVHSQLLQRPDDADLHVTAGFAAAGLGLKDEAVREGLKATTLVPVSRDNFTGPGYLAWLAQLYVRLGENAPAIDLLQQLLALPSSGGAMSPALLKLDPIWDPLRSDARFQKLLDGDPATRAAANP